jgi:hypothetical protein
MLNSGCPWKNNVLEIILLGWIIDLTWKFRNGRYESSSHPTSRKAIDWYYLTGQPAGDPCRNVISLCWRFQRAQNSLRESSLLFGLALETMPKLGWDTTLIVLVDKPGNEHRLSCYQRGVWSPDRLSSESEEGVPPAQAQGWGKVPPLGLQPLCPETGLLQESGSPWFRALHLSPIFVFVFVFSYCILHHCFAACLTSLLL